jgi:hypothetical protein
MKAALATVAVLAAAGLVASVAIARVMAQHGHADQDPHTAHGSPGKSAPTTRPALAVPSAMDAEHAHLHEELAAALRVGGKTAEAAGEVEAVLSKHFVEEDAYALPPLGLLEPLARGEQLSPEQARAAIAMADKLRANYQRMLDEHRQLVASLKALEAAATAEDRPRAAQFARALTLHAQNEEQVLYPAAMLVGEYLKLRPPPPAHGHDATR